MKHPRREVLALMGAMGTARWARAGELTNPAAEGSRLPWLTRSSSGGVAMSWVESREGESRRLLTATLEGGRWSRAETIAEGKQLMLNWADFPSIAATRSGMVAHWLERDPQAMGSYALKIAVKQNPGATWRTVYEAPAESREGYTGFLSFTVQDETVHAVFLHHQPSGTRFRLVEMKPDGTGIREKVLDADVCSCCQTTAALTRQGPIVAYRDHEEGSIRDISVMRYEGGSWTKPAPIHRDGWKLNACPVNGPSLAADGDFVAAAWYTGAQDEPRVLIARSNDGGRTFDAPLRLDAGRPVGRACVSLSRKTVVTTWLEKEDAETASVRVRALLPSGKLGPSRVVARVAAGRNSGFPRIVISGETAVIAWTGERVRTAEVALADLVRG